ncbi:MAG: hypothetical protein QM692_01480 [Thermomicrobiales bacterium]
MDPANFDDLTRRLTGRRSRRRAIPMLTSGLLGVASLSQFGETQAKRKKPKKVTLCLNGQTQTVPKKKRGGLLKQGATVGACAQGGGGGCGSEPACDACKRETCQNGACGCPAGMTRDANGICGEALNCAGTGGNVAIAPHCCSNATAPFPGQPGRLMCVPGVERCLANADCKNGGKCLGGMCPELYLATVGQACKVGIGCTGPGDCDTGRCRDGMCSSCTTSSDCVGSGGCSCNTMTGRCYSLTNWREVSGANCGFCPTGFAACESGDQSNRWVCKPACGHTFP